MPRALALLVLLAAADDAFLARLRLSPRAAEDAVYQAARSGHPYLPSACREVPPAARAEVARAAAAFARRYLVSDAFRARYQRDWAGEEPKAPETAEARARREADEEKHRLEQEARSRAELAQRAASETNPELKKVFQQALAAQEESRKFLESPEYQAQLAQARTMMAEAAKEEDARRLAAYQADHAAWERRKDPAVLLRERLAALRALAATVDWKARTVERGGRRVFADQALEAKSSEWKQLYRLGPEVVKVLQAAAADLEKELGAGR